MPKHVVDILLVAVATVALQPGPNVEGTLLRPLAWRLVVRPLGHAGAWGFGYEESSLVGTVAHRRPSCGAGADAGHFLVRHFLVTFQLHRWAGHLGRQGMPSWVLQ